MQKMGKISNIKDTTLDIGNRIRTEREKFKYSREEFAEIINVSTQFLSSIENGSRGMSFNTLEKICKALSVPADYILFGKMTNNNLDEINKLISSIDTKYLPIVEDLIRSYIKTIILTKNKNEDLNTKN